MKSRWIPSWFKVEILSTPLATITSDAEKLVIFSHILSNAP
ncbi:MAG TPA: hypothetical protein VFF80_08655 [Bacillota bacterium]|nr:hypothetical protein [Bacillota bacterium]